MSVKIRLSRGGAKKHPYYRIVVADARSPRDGRFIEKVGTYNPMVAADHPERLILKKDRIQYWLGTGAEPTERLARFFGVQELMPMPAASLNPEKGKPKKKAQERLKEQAKRDEDNAQAARQAEEQAKQTLEVKNADNEVTLAGETTAEAPLVEE